MLANASTIAFSSFLTFDNANFSYTVAGTKLILEVPGSSSADVNVTNGSHTISANIQLNDDSEFDISGSNILTVSGDIDDSGARMLTKTGTGTLTLTGESTYTGGTIISAGTLKLNNSSGIALNDGTGHDITINSGGTLLLGSDNQINDKTKMTLSGGTFNTGGFDQNMGSLTLSATSTIDFGGNGDSGDNSVLDFSNAIKDWDAFLLNIENWTGLGEGDDQLIFGGNLSEEGRLDQIRFIDPAGFAPGTYGARLIGNEVVPIPEPSAMIGAGLLSGLIFLDILRRRKQRREEETEAA